MLRVLFTLLSFSILACSSDRSVLVASAGKAACALCDSLGSEQFKPSQEDLAALAEADTTQADSTSADDETDAMEPEVVSFADANLERAVRRALKKPEGPLMVADLDSLVRIDAEEQSIKSLDGIEYCTALDTLRLWGNEIEDLSALSGLPSLSFLNLGNNHIENISALSSLTDLKWLSLWNNDIEDISPLSELPKLTFLNLGSNQIEDVSPLSGMIELRSLSLSDNKVVDVSALDGLTKLEYLGLLDNPIKIKEVPQQVPTLIERDVTISLVRQGPQQEPCTYAEGALSYSAGTQISPLVLPAAIGGTPPITYTASGLPPGLSFDPVARTISGTPNVAIERGCGISYTVTYTISDNAGASISRTFVMVIQP